MLEDRILIEYLLILVFLFLHSVSENPDATSHAVLVILDSAETGGVGGGTGAVVLGVLLFVVLLSHGGVGVCLGFLSEGRVGVWLWGCLFGARWL